MVALVAAGGLLAGMVMGSAPGRATAMRALGGLPALLRPDLAASAQPAFPAPVLPDLPRPRPDGRHGRCGAPYRGTRPIPGADGDDRAHRAPHGHPRQTSATPSAEPADVAAPPCAPTVRACVDLSANRSWLLRDGQVTYGPVPITHGRQGFRTPPGTFQVAVQEARPRQLDLRRRNAVVRVLQRRCRLPRGQPRPCTRTAASTCRPPRPRPTSPRSRSATSCRWSPEPGRSVPPSVSRSTRAGQRAMASAGSGRMPSRCARSTALTRSETPSFA